MLWKIRSVLEEWAALLAGEVLCLRSCLNLAAKQLPGSSSLPHPMQIIEHRSMPALLLHASHRKRLVAQRFCLFFLHSPREIGLPAFHYCSLEVDQPLCLNRCNRAQPPRFGFCFPPLCDIEGFLSQPTVAHRCCVSCPLQ